MKRNNRFGVWASTAAPKQPGVMVTDKLRSSGALLFDHSLDLLARHMEPAWTVESDLKAFGKLNFNRA